jgi:hypothetical protein
MQLQLPLDSVLKAVELQEVQLVAVARHVRHV